MKVGTDGTLLGAWARGGASILDIGTGTGLIALMMAQRFAEARIVAIDIDRAAFRQAAENVNASCFASRVRVVSGDVRQMSVNDLLARDADKGFDAIVCNPPFFQHSLRNPDEQKAMARHTDMLSYDELFASVSRLISVDGEFSSIIPFDCLDDFLQAASAAGFSTTRKCTVRTTPKKLPRRYLLAFSKSDDQDCLVEEGILENDCSGRSDWYRRLTADFYL